MCDCVCFVCYSVNSFQSFSLSLHRSNSSSNSENSAAAVAFHRYLIERKIKKMITKYHLYTNIIYIECWTLNAVHWTRIDASFLASKAIVIKFISFIYEHFACDYHYLHRRREFSNERLLNLTTILLWWIMLAIFKLCPLPCHSTSIIFLLFIWILQSRPSKYNQMEKEKVNRRKVN